MKDSLDTYIDDIKHLPPSPTLMVELLNLFKQPDHDVDHLVELIRHDPSVTAEILKRCNSAFFGSDSPATDIYDAILRLGVYEVYRLVSALHGARLVQVSAAKHGIDLEAAWEHSALTAIAADALAREVNEDEGSAFLSGLMHDIGKVVLACVDGAKYSAALKEANTEQAVSEAEKKAFGFNHSEIGGRLLKRWGLPDNISVPVSFHHHPQDAADFIRTAALLNLADTLAYFLSRDADELNEANTDAFSLQELKLDLEALQQVMARTRQDVKRVSGLFGIRRQ